MMPCHYLYYRLRWDDGLGYNGFNPTKAGIQGIDKHLSKNFLTGLPGKSLEGSYLVFCQCVFWLYGQFWQARRVTQ